MANRCSSPVGLAGCCLIGEQETYLINLGSQVPSDDFLFAFRLKARVLIN